MMPAAELSNLNQKKLFKLRLSLNCEYPDAFIMRMEQFVLSMHELFENCISDRLISIKWCCLGATVPNS